LEPVGEKRGRYYIAAKTLRDIHLKVMLDGKPRTDPYKLIG